MCKTKPLLVKCHCQFLMETKDLFMYMFYCEYNCWVPSHIFDSLFNFFQLSVCMLLCSFSIFHVPLCESILWWVFGPWPVHYRLVCLAVTSLWWISELQTEPPVPILITQVCFCTQTQHRCKLLPLIRLVTTSSLHVYSPSLCSCYCFWRMCADKLTLKNWGS